MHQITIEVKDIFKKDIDIIKELIQSDARLYRVQNESTYPLLLKLKHNNILDILTYIDPNNPCIEPSTYSDLTISIHPLSYQNFTEVAQSKHKTKKKYLESLLYNYYQLDLDVKFHTFNLNKEKELTFLNDTTLEILIYDNYMSTNFLLTQLKKLKADNRVNYTSKLFDKIMQFYITKLMEDNHLNREEYLKLLSAFRISKIEYEIDLIEKIIFLRHKLKVDCIQNKDRTKIFKDLHAKHNRIFKTTSNGNKTTFIRNEIFQYMTEPSVHNFDILHLGNFKARLRYSDEKFKVYSLIFQNLEKSHLAYLILFNTFTTIDETIDNIVNM